MACLRVLTMALTLLGAPVLAQPAMQPTAPQKMMSPQEKQKLQACQKQAADQNSEMKVLAKGVMDCMTKK